MRTEICLTIDTEFSAGGVFEHPDRYAPIGEPAVECAVAGKEQGLGFILDCLAGQGGTATFFVEALNTAHFGDAPMQRIAARILAAGHDVQLHLHPMWRHFRNPEWRRDLKTAPDDSCSGRSHASACEIIADGIATFRRWGLPDPIAVRAGNLRADLRFYRALGESGIRLASNIGLGMFQPPEEALHFSGGRHWIGDVLEVPILTYAAPRIGMPHRRRCLAITATSWPETRHLLWAAHRSGLSPVVILTHPFEFVKQRGFRFDRLHRNRVNQDRLRRLLAFVAEHDDEFVSVSFRDRAADWLASPGTPDPVLSVPAGLVLQRMVENGVNDLILQY